MMLPHGPDREAFDKASNADLGPDKLDNTMSFMFETRFPQHLTEFAGKEAPLAGRLHRLLGLTREEVRRNARQEMSPA
jgi:homogentisate 1,2-dioxygenase